MAFSLSDAFGALQPPPLPDANAIPDALARNTQLGAIRQAVQQAMGQAAPQMQQPQAPQHHGLFGGGIGSVLGRIGDALLTANGLEPTYANKIKNQQIGAAVANYLGNSDSALAAIFQQDPDVGLKLYQYRHPEASAAPEVVRELQAAGIDPASDEGRQILRQHIAGNGTSEPNFVRELEALGIDPHSPQALELYYGRNSPAGYLLKPPANGAPSAAESLPVVNSQEEYDALPSGSHYRDSQGNVGVKGGATASTPSPTFR